MKANGHRTRIALVDDQSLVLEGLRTLLEHEPGIDVAFATTSSQELLDWLKRDRVDVVVSDVRMPGISGFDISRRLRSAQPSTPVILLTTFDDRDLLTEAVKVGAKGFLLKGASPQDLITAIDAVARGGVLLNPVEVPAVRQGGTKFVARAGSAAITVSLTPRERSILRLAATGLSNKEIAKSLGLVEGTVKNYMSEVMEKLDSRDRTQAVIRAIGAGLI
ncbi:MAG: response regulator [Steroidobacteraceae bacterium]|jgi:DNA-binding NarL/FixJ family response regulator|nr:DNA-binding response regulator [Gammaproteobacteria bacterium]